LRTFFTIWDTTGWQCGLIRFEEDDSAQIVFVFFLVPLVVNVTGVG
jgi:hypothetical protein